MSIFTDGRAALSKQRSLSQNVAGFERLPQAAGGPGGRNSRKRLALYKVSFLPLCGIAQTLTHNAITVKLPCAPQCAEARDTAHG